MFRRALGGNGEIGDYVYRQLEPIIFGKIPYSPATAEINEIIRRANQTFNVSFQSFFILSKAIQSLKHVSNEPRSNYSLTELHDVMELGERSTVADAVRVLDTISAS